MPLLVIVLIDVFFLACIFVFSCWLFRKLFRRKFTLKGEILTLAAIAAVEVYGWQIVVGKGGALSWRHLAYITLPAFAFSAVMAWWVHDAEEET